VLVGLRRRLRELNLHDTGRGRADHPDASATDEGDYRMRRTLDGEFNDLGEPLMGSVGSRFGRNVPVAHTVPERDDELLSPSPRLVSERLLARTEFQPASTLNLLAAAWIQFEVHDWFSHGEVDDTWDIAVDSDDDWPQHPMRIKKTRPDPSPSPGPPTYVTDTHTGGTHPNSTVAPGNSPTGCVPASTASCTSTSSACRRSTPTPTSLDRPATSGSGWRCCIRCSCANTTRSAIGSRSSTPRWTINGSTTPHG
jgi:hypothetical protein